MRIKSVLLLIGLLAATAPAASQSNIPQITEDALIARIRAKITPLYIKYTGVECTREIVSKQYDSRNDLYLGGYTVLVRRKEFFYKRAKYTVLKYSKDGKDEPAWKYNYITRKPAFQPFDPDTDKNYDIKLKGKKSIKNVLCWEFDVIPKKKTSRHIIGSVYFTVKGLDLFYLEGTVAKFPISLKSLDMQIYFKKVGDAYVMSNGTYTFVVHIPVFYPHRKYVQTFTSSDDILMPAEQKKD